MPENASPEWVKNYHADSAHRFAVRSFLTPDNLLLASALLGVRPAQAIVSHGAVDRRGLTYCELGSGHGLSLSFMAARDPGGRYCGVESNPRQIHNARAFATAAGLDNIAFSEEHLENLDKADLPQCDIVVLHGIWSWISAKAQKKIAGFLRTNLKPGGLCYVSYNCSAGRAADVPLQKLLLAAVRPDGQSSTARFGDTIGMVEKMAGAGAQYFAQNPVQLQRLKELKNPGAAHLIDEYLHSNWQTYFMHEVSAALASADLTFAGSTNMARNRNDLALPTQARPFIEKFGTPERMELLRDIWTGNTFRQDLYVKAPAGTARSGADDLLGALRFALLKPLHQCSLKMVFPGGTATIPQQPFGAIIAALSKQSLKGADIGAIIKKSGTDTSLGSAIQVLLAMGCVTLVSDRAAAPRIARSIANFDSAIASLVDGGHDLFAASIGSSGIAADLSSVDYFFWRATKEKAKDRVRWVLDRLKATGRLLQHEGRVVTDEPEAVSILNSLAANFDSNVRPALEAGAV